MTLAEISQAFVRLAEVINRELTPEKILRAACEAYNERMAVINRRPLMNSGPAVQDESPGSGPAAGPVAL